MVPVPARCLVRLAMACTRLTTRHYRQPNPSTQTRRTLPADSARLTGRLNLDDDCAQSGQFCAFVLGVRRGCVSSPRARWALLTPTRFRTRERLADEGDGDEEEHLAERHDERPERLVVVVGRCPGAQLVGDASSPRQATAPQPRSTCNARLIGLVSQASSPYRTALRAFSSTLLGQLSAMLG
jgi:hypothetical protein